MAIKVLIPSTAPSNRVSISSAGSRGPQGLTGPYGPKAVTIVNPTASEDITLLYTTQQVTINAISSVLLQSATSNVAFTLRYETTRSNTGTEITTGGMFCDSNTLGNTITTFDNATIPANNFLWLETSSISGSVQELHLTIEFT